MTGIFFSFWRISSFVFFMATLFYIYIGMPEDIAVNFDDKGLASKFMSKQHFFYYAAAIVGILNLVFLLAKNQLKNINFLKLNPNSVWAKNKTAIVSLLTGWVDAFLALTNTFLVFVILGINSINKKVNPSLDFNYNYLGLLAVVLILVLVFFLPLRLLFTNPKDQVN